MKIYGLKGGVLGGIFIAASFAPLSIAAINQKPFVVPELKEWKGGDGNLSLKNLALIDCQQGDTAVLNIARTLASDMETMFGEKLAVTSGIKKPGRIHLALSKDKKLGDEGYQIKVTPTSIHIDAPTRTGLYWGTRTVLQILEQTPDHTIPVGTIRDYPDYPLRGFMIDCARKFIPMSYLRDLVKIMSYYKMNTLQVHLNDNGFHQYFDNDWNKTYSAFRLESDTYPGLTARDGSYSKQEFRDFQQNANNLYVEIIPEIDVPAHTLSFSQYKPEIGSREYGADHLDLFNPETYNFLDGLFKEYLEGENPVFSGKRVHIGTDEYSNQDQRVVEKFREFTDRYIRFVESYGKQACVWGALTHAKGETPVKSDNVVMGAWYNGYADPAEMVRQGYKLISIPDGYLYIVPAAGYYYDYLNEPYLYSSWTPAHVGKEVFKEKDPAILGGMFAVWNDVVGNGVSVKDIHHRLFPAMQTLSAKMWTGTGVTLPYEQFNAQRNSLSEAPGVNQRAKVGSSHQLVYHSPSVAAGTTLPIDEIGYDYTISFDVTGSQEVKGTPLFSNENAVFYLSDPVAGMLGFARDGYLNKFRYSIAPGEKAHIEIMGNNRCTALKVNGKMVDILEPHKTYMDKEGKKSMTYLSTLVFPLRNAGNFNSTVSNLKVFNYCVDKLSFNGQ